MPTCCIKNCKSRTGGATKTKDIKFFPFPQNPALKKKWFETCHREEENLNVNSSRICERHFSSDCMEKKWTKTHTLNTEARLMNRLKAGSIPTQLLDLPKQDTNRINRYSTLEDDEIEPMTKNTCRTGIPKYEELVACVEIILSRGMPHLETSTDMECSRKYTENPPLRWYHVDVREPETEIEKLQRRLKEAKERNRLLLLENKQLRKAWEMKSNDLEAMKKNEQRVGQDTAADILHAIFTPGQVKKLMAPNAKRIKWSADDISSAIALRLLSGKTYKYLREVKQLPLPCESTLRNWAASFDTRPGVLKDVLKIMQSKGEDLSVADKITVLTFDEIYISNILDLERRE
ncbi:Transposable element P transposase [Formica fusca]